MRRINSRLLFLTFGTSTYSLLKLAITTYESHTTNIPAYMGIGSIQGINDTIKLCNALEWCTRERSHETTLLSCLIGSDRFSNLPRRLKPDIFCMRFYLTWICVDGSKQCFRQYSNLCDWEAIFTIWRCNTKRPVP